MNDAEKRKQALRFDAIISALQPGMSRRVYKEKVRYINHAIKAYAQTNYLDDNDMIEHRRNMSVIFTDYYSRIFKFMVAEATKQFTDLSKSAHKIPYAANQKANLFELFFAEWLIHEGGRRIRLASKTTENDLIKAIGSVVAGTDPEIRLIRAAALAIGLSVFRANTIARTETHNAGTYATKRTAEKIASDLDLKMLKEWLPILDKRTRADHAAMSGVDPIAMNALFKVGDVKMDRPGDPEAPLDQIINCRCQLVFETQ